MSGHVAEILRFAPRGPVVRLRLATRAWLRAACSASSWVMPSCNSRATRPRSSSCTCTTRCARARSSSSVRRASVESVYHQADGGRGSAPPFPAVSRREIWTGRCVPSAASSVHLELGTGMAGPLHEGSQRGPVSQEMKQRKEPPITWFSGQQGHLGETLVGVENRLVRRRASAPSFMDSTEQAVGVLGALQREHHADPVCPRPPACRPRPSGWRGRRASASPNRGT